LEVIVVDDNSPDGIWGIVEKLRKQYANLKIIRRFTDRGLARAVVRGWKAASGEIFAVMDADFQHLPDILADLLRAMDEKGIDIAVASRHTQGGGVSRWNIFRRAISWRATLAATWFLPVTLRTLRDRMSGYFAFRRAVVQDVGLNPEGYKILLEVLVRGHYRHVKEIPYTFVERQRGGSKLGPRQMMEYVHHLFRLSCETGEMLGFIKYCLVGTAGVLVNTGVLIAGLSLGFDHMISGLFAVETAVGTNFLLNEFWTFKNLSAGTPTLRTRSERFLRFNALCAGGGLIYVIILKLLTNYAGLHYLILESRL
jgi:dolichol-phosphate mannosyltransferase